MQRYIALALLNAGQTVIYNPGFSNDDLASLDIARQMGASVNIHPDHIIVSSNGKPHIPGTILCGESGLAIRMFAPVAASFGERSILEAAGSLLNRDLTDISKVLSAAGSEVELENDKAPVKIKGRITPRSMEVDGSMGSQVITGLMLAFAYTASEPVHLKISNIKSAPYLELTSSCLEKFGCNVEQHEDTFTIQPGTGVGNRKVKVEGDWSNAAFLCVAAALNGNLFISGMNEGSRQGDSIILDILQNAGASLDFLHDGIVVKKTENLRAFNFDATHYPDLFPPLCVLAMKCKGNSRIKGLHRLVNKESNRKDTLLNVIQRFNGKAIVENDEMVIEGDREIRGADVTSANDHRIAMMATIAGTFAQGITYVRDAEAVNKSWPGFFDAMRSIKAKISSHE